MHRAEFHVIARAFGKTIHPNRLIRLQLNHQAIGASGHFTYQLIRHGFEHNHNFCHTFGHAFACAQIKWHTRKSPIVDFGFQCNISFGVAVDGHTCFRCVVLRRFALRNACGVLTAHHIVLNIFYRPRLERAQNREFFIANAVGIHSRRRVHGDETQQLQQMILHHIAQCARLVIKLRTTLHTEFFRNRDLHIGNIISTQNWFKKTIAKTQSHQVLHRFFTQIMVNAENLRLFEVFGKHIVDFDAGCQIMPQRLFNHNTCVLILSMSCQAFTNQLKNHRRDCKVKYPLIIGILRIQNRFKLFKCTIIGRIKRHIQHML